MHWAHKAKDFRGGWKKEQTSDVLFQQQIQTPNLLVWEDHGGINPPETLNPKHSEAREKIVMLEREMQQQQ